MIVRYIFSLFVICFIFIPNSQADEAAPIKETIRIAVDEWPPYQSQTYQYFGSAHRIITEAFQSVGIKVEYGWFPWARSLQYAKEGKWDGAALSQKTPVKENDFYFPNPVFDVKKVFFHLKKYPFQWRTMKDLNNVPIGVTLGYMYGDEFETAAKTGKIQFVRVRDNKTNFSNLLTRRIRAFPFEHDAGYYMLQNEFPEDYHKITHHKKPLQTVFYYLILSKQNDENQEKVTLFNKGLKNLKERGLIQQYLSEGLRGEYKKEGLSEK